MEFEWDEAKRLGVLEKHGIDFNDLDKFFDGDILHLSADSAVEPREKAIGWTGFVCIAVIFTRRGERIRLITARRARADEQRAYRATYT